MQRWNRWRRGGGTDGGEVVEQRRAAEVAQRRDLLRRWRGGEIGGAVTLRR